MGESDTFDYSGVERIAREAGLTLSRDFARADGVCAPAAGQQRTVPYVGAKPAESREHRHFIGDNTSYGHVHTSGAVVLEVRLGHNSSADPTKVIADTLRKYRDLRVKLDLANVSYDDRTGIAEVVWPK